MKNLDIEPINCDELSLRDRRSVILHLLYAMDSFDYQASLESIVDNFSRGFGYTISTDSYIFITSQAVIDSRDALDAEIKPLLANWSFDRISSCTKLILRLALWELIHEDISPNIVINEAVELAKCFAEVDSYKFINGILDNFANKK